MYQRGWNYIFIVVWPRVVPKFIQEDFAKLEVRSETVIEIGAYSEGDYFTTDKYI